MNDPILAVSDPISQATSRVAVLMPALVPGAFDYLAPDGTAAGALVEATLAGRKLIGVVWKGGLAPYASLTPAASGSRGALRG